MKIVKVLSEQAKGYKRIVLFVDPVNNFGRYDSLDAKLRSRMQDSVVFDVTMAGNLGLSMKVILRLSRIFSRRRQELVFVTKSTTYGDGIKAESLARQLKQIDPRTICVQWGGCFDNKDPFNRVFDFWVGYSSKELEAFLIKLGFTLSPKVPFLFKIMKLLQ